MNPDVKAFFHADSATWSYVVSNPQSGAAAVIDPVLDFDAASGKTATDSAALILAYVREHRLQVEWILETHAHADHISSAPWLAGQLRAKVAIGQGITTVQSTFKSVFNLEPGFAIDGSQFDRLLREGDELELGKLRIKVIATPGHTSDSMSYLIGDALFVGDTMFMPDVGTARCDFPGGDAAQLYHSIRKLMTLPKNTRVFVCHDYPGGERDIQSQTSIADQEHSNVHIHAGVSEEKFVDVRQARDKTLAVPNLIFASIQMNIRAGHKPPPESNGRSYLKIPLDFFK